MNAPQNIGGMLADQLDRLLHRRVTRELLLSIEEGQFPESLWAEIEGLGARLALAPESSGGAGLAWCELEELMRTLGRHAAPAPLGETMIGAALLAEAGLEIPSGPLAIATGVLSLDSQDRVTGRDRPVAWVSVVPHVIAVAERGGERFLCLIARDSVELIPQQTIARIPSAGIKLQAVKPQALARISSAIEPMSALAVLRAVQIAGGLERVLALCVDYANTRQQFGKPIGKFQAIQHYLAELAMQTAAAQVAGLYGCRCLDAGAARRGAAVAKIRAGKAANIAASLAHQVFGAIGTTEEHSLHFYTRRLWQWRGEAGSEMEWAEKLGSATLEAGGAALWPGIAG